MVHQHVLKLDMEVVFATSLQITVHTQLAQTLKCTNESIHATIQKYGKEESVVEMLLLTWVTNQSWNVTLSATKILYAKSLYFKTTTAGLFLTHATRFQQIMIKLSTIKAKITVLANGTLHAKCRMLLELLTMQPTTTWVSRTSNSNAKHHSTPSSANGLTKPQLTSTTNVMPIDTLNCTQLME